MGYPYSTPHGLVASFGPIVLSEKYFRHRADDSWRQQSFRPTSRSLLANAVRGNMSPQVGSAPGTAFYAPLVSSTSSGLHLKTCGRHRVPDIFTTGQKLLPVLHCFVCQ